MAWVGEAAGGHATGRAGWVACLPACLPACPMARSWVCPCLPGCLLCLPMPDPLPPLLPLQVNRRLGTEEAEDASKGDPAAPHVQFPPPLLCPQCRWGCCAFSFEWGSEQYVHVLLLECKAGAGDTARSGPAGMLRRAVILAHAQQAPPRPVHCSPSLPAGVPRRARQLPTRQFPGTRRRCTASCCRTTAGKRL